MNRCEYCLEHLSAYIDGEMSESEMKDIEEHLKECDSCAHEFDILKTIVSTCSELVEELPDGFSSSLHTRLEKAREDMTADRNRKGKIKLFSQIAAGFVIVVTLGFAIRLGFFDTGFTRNGPVAGKKSASDAAPMALGPSVVEFSAPRIVGQEDNRSAGAIQEDAEDPQEFSIAQSMDNIPDDIKNQEDSGVIVHFKESSDKTAITEKYNTEITIYVDDIGKAIESIMAIDEKIGKSRESNTAYLEDYIKAYRGGTRSNVVELKLVYTSEKVEKCFINEIQSAFPDIQVDSVPSSDKGQDEDEFIKIIIEKKN